MEQKEINIAELLKDCKKGCDIDGEYYTRLYSPIFPCAQDPKCNCSLLRVFEENGYTFIEVQPDVIEGINLDEKDIFFEEGSSCLGGECLLFPSKEVRDWRYFNVKYTHGNKRALDLLYTNGGKMMNGTTLTYNQDGVFFIENFTNYIKCISDKDKIGQYILSTGTELKLEEEQPKFKVGDVVKADIAIPLRSADGSVYYALMFVLSKVAASRYEIDEELMEGKTFSLATPEEIAPEKSA